MDVRVSYAGRVGISIAIGVFLMLPFVYGLVASLLAKADDDGAKPKVAACVRVLSVKSALTCTDTAPFVGRDYRLSTDSSGTYTITVKDTGSAPTPMCIELSRNGTKLTRQCAASAAPAVVSVALDRNTADLHIEDASYAGKLDHPYTLTITNPTAKADTASGAAVAPIVAILVLPLIFLVAIPLYLTAEKSRLPLYLDATGVRMRNGGHFPWHAYQFTRVLNEVRRGGRPYEVGVELVFTTGSAILRYRPVVNKGEVFAVIQELKAGRNPFA